MRTRAYMDVYALEDWSDYEEPEANYSGERTDIPVEDTSSIWSATLPSAHYLVIKPIRFVDQNVRKIRVCQVQSLE